MAIKLNKKLVILLPILTVVIVAISIIRAILISEGLSEDQKSVVKLFGYPSQFVITYVPRGEADNPKLVRSEVWYYTEQELEISFLGGIYVDEAEYLPESAPETTNLKPEDFSFFLEFEDMAYIFGEQNIQPVDVLPVFYEEGETATYLTDTALFIIENDQLTYFQTIGAPGELPLEETPVVEIPEEDVVITKVYKNSTLKIQMNYPAQWFLDDEDIVLSSYDTGYLEKDIDLPKEILKCDFIKFDDTQIKIKKQEIIYENGVKISKGEAEDVEETGMGLGDSIIFLFEKENRDTVGLLCFSYNENFFDELLESFKTFKFL